MSTPPSSVLVARFVTPYPMIPRLIEVVSRPWYTSGRLPDDLRDPWQAEFDVYENGRLVSDGFLAEWSARDFLSEYYPGAQEYFLGSEDSDLDYEDYQREHQREHCDFGTNSPRWGE